MRLHIALICLAATLLAACQSAASRDSPQLRVMLRVPEGRVADSAEWLNTLSQQAQTPVRFAAAISARWAAYTLQCPDDDAQCTRPLEKLRASGQTIELDHHKSIQ